MLVVACWKWNGWRGAMYRAEHVNALRRMVAAHLDIPHKFVCVTDSPGRIECDTIPIWDIPVARRRLGVPNCYRRLRIFAEEASEIFGGDRLLSIDLDCVVLDDLTPLVTDDELRLCQGRSCPYNASMILHTLGTRTFIWDDFDPEDSRRLLANRQQQENRLYHGSDQAWISYCAKGEPTWGEEDGVFHYSRFRPTARAVFFTGPHKPWTDDLKEINPLLWETYRQWL